MGERAAYSGVHIAPHVFVTSHGARGASQHCPILRAGIGDIINVKKNSKATTEKNYKISRLQRHEEREL